MPQTPKKQKDVYPVSSPPAKVNQRTGDVAPGQSKFTDKLQSSRTSDTVGKSFKAVNDAKLQKNVTNVNESPVMKAARAAEAADRKANPIKYAGEKYKATSETLQKNLVRNNQATDLLKLPKSNKGKYDQLFKEGDKLRNAGNAELERAKQLRDPKYIGNQQLKTTAETRQDVFKEANKLEQDLAKNQGRRPVNSRPSTAAQIQSKAAPKPSVIETATKTAVGTGVLASPLAKGVGTVGVVAAAQKAAGLPPKQENAAVDEWNKRTNYGRIQGPTSKALGVVNVKPGSK